MHSSQSQYVYMGTITKPHGIRGEMALYTSVELPKNLMGTAFLGPPSKDTSFPPNAQKVTVKQVRMHHQTALITIEGIVDRTQAENYRRYHLFIPREAFPQLSTDEYYQADLLGLEVYVEEEEEDVYLGRLSSIDAPAGQELWTIITDDEQEVLLPAVPEFVQAINLEEGFIIISPPPGLIDIYLQTGPTEEA